MLVFFTGLYTLGVNALVVTDKGEKASMQISDIVKRKSPEDMPQGTVWVEKSGLTFDSCLSGTGNAPSGCICR